MTKCLQCGMDLATGEIGGRLAGISGSIMGDEHTESYFLCERCGLYTVEVFYEPFLGEAEISYRGPLTRLEGDRAVALIQTCPEPWNKKCRCAAHLSYFEGMLD